MVPVRSDVKESFRRAISHEALRTGANADEPPAHVVGRIAMHYGYADIITKYMLPDITVSIDAQHVDALLATLNAWVDSLRAAVTLPRGTIHTLEERERMHEAATCLEARTQLWAVLTGIHKVLKPFWRDDAITDNCREELIIAAKKKAAELNALMARPESVAFLCWAAGTDYPGTVRLNLSEKFKDTTPWLDSRVIQKPWTHAQQSTGKKARPEFYAWSLDILHFFP